VKTENYSIAIHEAGHSVVASHFKIAAYPELTPGGESRLIGAVDPKHAGLCHLDDGLVTNFQNAALCWAGPMAECLYGHPAASWLPPFKPSRLMLRDWHGMMMQQIKQFSDGDRVGILGYRDTWRSCKSAFAVVTKNKARIIRLAKAMTAGRKATTSMPLPEKFPSAHADFLRLICSSDEANFERFIASRVSLHLTNNRTMNLEDAKLSLGTSYDDAYAMSLNLQRTIHGNGFPDAESWFAAARAFKTWMKTAPATRAAVDGR
jgi:hypothetical protein